ncbi:unnamed protein product, partial [Symbiodinium sp. CCMP2456]
HELDDQGKNKDDSRLRAAGFEVGQNVVRKSDASMGTIQTMTASEIKLQVEGQVVTVASESFLAGEWRACTSKQESIAVEFTGSLPVDSSEFQLAECKARILHQIRADEDAGSAHYSNLQLFLKPNMVKAGKRFEKSELVLIPSTHRIDFKKPGSGSAGAIVAGLIDIKGCTYEVCLSSCLSQSPNQVLHPFWVMRTSANLAECNLELLPRNCSSRKLKMNREATWQIPFARNMKVINEGDSLVLFKPSTAAKPVWSITGGMLKKKMKWLVKTKEVDDRLFVQVDKWDRSFIQFVTGFSGIRIQDPHHLSIPAFQDFLDMRKTACDELYNQTIRDAAAVAGDPEPRTRNAREEDLYVAGRIVEMACKEITFDSQTLPAQKIAALWSVKDPVIWVELSSENLDYIGLFMRRGLAEYRESNAQSRRRKKLRADADAVVKSSPKRKRRRERKRKAAPVDEEEEEPIQEEIHEESSPVIFPLEEHSEDLGDPVADLLAS